MMFFPPLVRRAGVLATCATATFLLTTNAFADLKVETRSTTSKGQSVDGTIYYKGKKMRSQSKQNTILFDGNRSLIYSINDATKTYTVVPFGQLANNPMAQMLDIQSTVDVKPGGKSKTILGKPTRNIVYTATIKITLKKEFLDRMQAQAKAQGGTAPAAPQLPVITVSGESWVTEQVKLPSGALATSMAPLAAVPGLKPLLDKFAEIKGVPLQSTVTVSQKGGNRDEQNQTMTTNATSINEANLPDSLFAIPSGYVEKQAGSPGGMRRQ